MDNNDIALIELSEPLRFSDRIQPICLPDAQACLPEGTKCAATGWGVTDKTGISPPPNALNEVGLKEWIQITFLTSFSKVGSKKVCEKSLVFSLKF